MNRFVKPAVSWMNRFKYSRKLIMLAVITASVVCALAYQMLTQTLDILKFSRKELIGMEYVSAVLNTMQTLQQMSQLQHSNLADASQVNDKISTLKAQLATNIVSLDQKNDMLAKMGGSTGAWFNLKNNLDPQKNTINDYSQTMIQLRDLISNVCDESNLTLDPDLLTYYLMDVTCTKLPELIDNITFLERTEADSVANKSITEDDNNQIVVRKALFNYDLTEINQHFKKVFSNQPDLIEIITPVLDKLNYNAKAFIQLLSQDLAQEKQTFSTASTNLNDQITQLSRLTMQKLNYYIEVRVKQKTSEFYINLSIVIGGLLLLSYLFMGVYYSIITSVDELVRGSDQLAAGDLIHPINLQTRDEMSNIADSFNLMQQTIKKNEEKLRQSEKETRHLLDNIIKTANAFSIHSSQIAAGNLTQRLAAVDNEVMAKLGSDLNTMTENLTNLTKKILESTDEMGVSLEQVGQSVNVLNSGASEQASSINQITAALQEIEKSSDQTRDKAKNLGSLAERTREKGQLGLESVLESIEGMKAVREEVELIAQTILDLSSQTQQVGEITSVVNIIAQQSKMLALNASIEAAKAGEAGKGFAIVASEVKNLAERSEQSLAQVQKILENIRHTAEKAVMVTEEGTKKVDHGKKLVEQTGEVVKNLNAVIHETSLASQQIEAAVNQEAIGIEQITAGMNEINQVTTSLVTHARQTQAAVENLESVSKSLNKLIDVYKI